MDIRARGSVDRATDSGSVGRGFKSLRARFFKLITQLPGMLTKFWQSRISRFN